MYFTWLANAAIVKKYLSKWNMCIDFLDFNSVCLKNSYPLPNIKRLIDGTSEYKMNRFMDVYSRLNQIKVNL